MSTEPGRASGGERAERVTLLGLSLVLALVSLTCLGRGELVSRRAAAPPVQASTAGSAQPAAASTPAPSPSLPSSAPAPAASESAAAPDPTQLDLRHFYAALSELERHARKSSVRVLWLGDSHTAADYLTGAVRAGLQQRFGAGGPGFVRVGANAYRHSQVAVVRVGDWRVEPNPPSRRSPQDDGVFGLGGMRTTPRAGARVSFQPKKGTLQGAAEWELWFSLAERASFRVTLGGSTRTVPQDTPVESVPGSPIARLRLSGAASDELELVALGGVARFYGLSLEGSEPGVVLDTAGIDGARVATPLAWAEQPFEAELAARSPELVVFAYGTNEAFDAEKVEKYRAEYHALLERVRKGAPNSDCLLVGPPDAVATSGGSEPRVTEIDALQRSTAAELGCGYLSQLGLMGGPGSFEQWLHEQPPRARPDRLHLTPKGYESIGAAIVSALLGAYDRRAGAH